MSSIGNIFHVIGFCVGNSLVTGEFPSQRPVTTSFDIFFHLCLNKWLSTESRRWWFEMPSRSLWCHFNGFLVSYLPSVQVLAWCHHVTSHYLNQCWSRSQSQMASLGHNGFRALSIVIAFSNIPIKALARTLFRQKDRETDMRMDMYAETSVLTANPTHDDVIKWKHFPRYWPFVRGIHRWIPLTKASDAHLWCFLWSAP